MRHVLLLAAAVVPLIVATTEEANAQRRFGGGGFHADGGAWGARGPRHCSLFATLPLAGTVQASGH